MVKSLLFNGIFLTILFSVGIANSYEERTVYTQALLSITSHHEEKVVTTSYNGKYGQDSPKAKASGTLYYAGDNIMWCETLTQPPKIKSKRWIALIPRGNCSYESKIKLAQSYNASAAIIFYDEPVSVPVMSDKVSDMVSIMVSKESGARLVNLVTEQGEAAVECEILVGTHYVDRRWKVSRTSVLFVLVSFILLMCISLAWLVFYYVQRFRHIYRNDRKEKQLLSAAKKAISKLKTIPFQSANKEDEDESCAVCLENYKDGETLRVLPCRHEFHKSCIDPWLLNHRTCPMCKSNILKSLGVEIPENINLSEHDVEGIDTEAPTTINPTVSIEEPQTSPAFRPGLTTAHAWTEQPSTARYSSSFSNASDTDSEKSTVALVSTA